MTFAFIARFMAVQRICNRRTAAAFPDTAIVSNVKNFTTPLPDTPIINGNNLEKAHTKPRVPIYATNPGNILSNISTDVFISHINSLTDIINGVDCVSVFEKSYHTFAISLTASMPSGLTKALFHMLLALSIIACAVSCCMAYSFDTAVASL